MSPTTVIPTFRGERLSWREICSLYPDEWVVLVDVEHENDDEDNGELLAAVVVGHSKNRGDCLRESRALRAPGEDCAHLYTGEIVPRPFLSIALP